jgi:hypothetical protein
MTTHEGAFARMKFITLERAAPETGERQTQDVTPYAWTHRAAEFRAEGWERVNVALPPQ